MASAVAIASLDVIRDEKLAERYQSHQIKSPRFLNCFIYSLSFPVGVASVNVLANHISLLLMAFGSFNPKSNIYCRSEQLGKELREQLTKIQQQFPTLIKEVRGRGLFTAVELNSKALLPVTAYDICLKLKERGILAKPTHDSIIRLTPPLSIRYEIELVTSLLPLVK